MASPSRRPHARLRVLPGPSLAGTGSGPCPPDTHGRRSGLAWALSGRALREGPVSELAQSVPSSPGQQTGRSGLGARRLAQATQGPPAPPPAPTSARRGRRGHRAAASPWRAGLIPTPPSETGPGPDLGKQLPGERGVDPEGETRGREGTGTGARVRHRNLSASRLLGDTKGLCTTRLRCDDSTVIMPFRRQERVMAEATGHL